MSGFGSGLAYLCDPRLSLHATSVVPAWLWSADVSRVLWANPIAAAIFDAPSPAALAGSTIDPKSSAALQIARLAGSLPHGSPPRLERLRGFGARLGRTLMCACSRVTLADRTTAILVIATEPAGPSLPLAERARRLLAGCDEAAALFSPDGTLLHATPAAQSRFERATTFAALGIEKLAGEALAAGSASGHPAIGAITVERIGADAATVLLAILEPQPAFVEQKPTEPVAPPSPPPAPTQPTVEDKPPVIAAPPAAPVSPPVSTPASPPDRRQPLRFVWQLDAEGRFTIDSDEFIAMIGLRTAAALGQPWDQIAATLGLDPEGQVARAFASRDTWSGITVAFPIDTTGERLTVELSGLPVFDRDRGFRGYRGFGVCRDVARMTELIGTRPAATSPETKSEPQVARDERPTLTVVPPSENVVPFRSSAPPDKAPTLTPVERKAFGELASRLTARLRNAESHKPGDIDPGLDAIEPTPPEPKAEGPASELIPERRERERMSATDQRPILDRLPVGVLVYRLDKLIYANRAFLDWTGYGDLHALAEAGGLDALFIEPGAAPVGDNGAKSLAITTNRGDTLPVEARLFTTPWDGESALVLMLTNATAAVASDGRAKTADAALRRAETEALELRSILDAATDGVILLDREGQIISLNRGAEALFGYKSEELVGRPFVTMFAPESQRTAVDSLHGSATDLDDGREVIGWSRQGRAVPLFMTLGRIAAYDEKLCAVFRDISPWKQSEGELLNAKQQAEKASSAKSDFLAKISHEIRTPLNAIIGFSEVMMEERFGPVGNERYKQYLRDINASGGHVVSLLNDLLDLSKIEAGKLELSFASVDLNELIQQCVALMQPQANRQRIIIRTSLSPTLPLVVADARSVRQIALNLLSNSIKFTGTGGQVIVSTALNDSGGEVILRVRDTGVGMSEKEIAIALEPFRQLAASVRWGSSGTGLGLPLTKALAEANRATFSIKSAVNAGTLVEVAFPGARLAAE